MHPAPSIIVFTSLSGLGFGFLAFLAFGFAAPTGWAAFFSYGTGFALSVAGLLASTLHLGHPERALKAFTQWRSSWLSREGWLAVAALLVMGLQAFAAVFFAGSLGPVAWLGGGLCLATVFATSMIYAQLKTVPRWNHWTTPAVFMSFALTGGALLSGQTRLSMVLLVISLGLSLIRQVQTEDAFATSGSTVATATGLGKIGTPRLFEKPHTGENYLTHEMVYQLGRKHAQKLWVIGLALAFAVPFVILLISGGLFATALAGAVHLAGILTLRWLFFAQAEHVVGLYYGR